MHREHLRQQRKLARGCHAVAATHQNLVGGSAACDVESCRDAAARRLAEVGFARQEILLITNEVARRQETAVEIARPFAPHIFDQSARRAQRLDLFRRNRFARGAFGEVDHGERSSIRVAAVQAPTQRASSVADGTKRRLKLSIRTAWLMRCGGLAGPTGISTRARKTAVGSRFGGWPAGGAMAPAAPATPLVG